MNPTGKHSVVCLLHILRHIWTGVLELIDPSTISMSKQTLNNRRMNNYDKFMKAVDIVLDTMLSVMIKSLPKERCQGCSGEDLDGIDPDTPFF
jgi:hypothetical protein